MNSPSRTPRYVWYGDDFTGATDTLATVADAGLRALLFLGVPSPSQLRAAGPLDALGIAGAARTMDPSAMTAELEPVARFQDAMRAPVLHYKCCSTFDSSPAVGSLGMALRILNRDLRSAFLPVLGGQPSLGRYCTFGNLYARAGTDGAVYRVDRHPTMSRHPVTPMGEADLRRHLAAQGLADVSLIDLRLLDTLDDTALDASVDALVARGTDAVLFDVARDADLERIGRLVWRRACRAPLVALGASSVAQALIAHWRTAGEIPRAAGDTAIPSATGPVFVLAGSQSPVTARQVEAALAGGDSDGSPYRGVPLDVDALVCQPAAGEALAGLCARTLNQGSSVLAFTSPARPGGPAAHEVAKVSARLLARVLELAPVVRRVGVAGGDTASMAVQALGLWALSHAGTLCPGVSLTRARADAVRLDGIELMLKGGQMGPPDLFARLNAGIAAAPQRGGIHA